MATGDILAFIGAYLPYVLGGAVFTLLAFVALGVAFFYRGKTLQALQSEVEEAEAERDVALQRLEDGMAALHTQAARAEELDRLRPQYDAVLAEASDLKARLSAQQAHMAAREDAIEKELHNLEKLRKEMRDEFDKSAQTALNTNRKAFLDLANETFSKHRESAKAELGERQQAINALLQPVQDTLKRYEKGLSDVEKARQEAYGALSAELKSVATGQGEVRKEAAKLAQAMRGEPKARGRWGEHQLQNVMELSGMSQYVDFQTQVHIEGKDQRYLPDAVIRLPGGRHLIVDAKTSMSAYLDALEAGSDAEREALLDSHAKQIKEHVKSLASKRYWESQDDTPDFVVMFLPGENLFSAAVERMPDLIDFGMKSKVLITTPTTLMAVAKAVAYGWRQERMADNAKMIADLGQELYRRLATLGDSVAQTGKNLDRAVNSYNKMVGSLEGSVLPQARKFRDLEVEGTGEALPPIVHVDSEAREPAQGRDLLFDVDAQSSEQVTKLTPPSERLARN